MIKTCFVILVVGIALWAIAAALFTWAWNAVVPDVFHGPHIEYWQAFAIFILLSAIGGFFHSNNK
jgi:hypothetical protein